MNEFEIGILDFISEHLKCDFLDAVMPAVTRLGDAGLFWIILSVIFIFTKKYRRCGVAMAIALIIMLVSGNMIIKNLVARTRPFDINTAVELIIHPPSDFSFPSGHTFASFSAAAAIFFSGNKKLGIAALILAGLIAFSRLYLYVHYPTDVIAGTVFGLINGYFSVIIANKLMDKIEMKNN